MTEKQIEKILRDTVKKAGGIAYKFISPGNAGVPDRIVILPNRWPIFVELKTEDGKTTPLQDRQIVRLKKLGQNVWDIRGLPALLRFFSFYDLLTADEIERIKKRHGL